MIRSHSLLALLAPLVLACSLPMSSDEPAIANRCDSDDACGASGVCIAGSCVAKEAALDGLTIVVDIPAGASFGGGSKHVIAGDNLGLPLAGRRDSGFFFPVDLVTGPMSDITATLLVSDDPCLGGLPAAAVQHPMQLELQPVGHPAGLGLQTYTLSTSSDELAGEYKARGLVPAGKYDIYVAPGASPTSPECRKPPFILYSRVIPGGTMPFDIAAPETITLQGTIVGYDVSQWTIDLVENGRGRAISTKATAETNTGAYFDGEQSTFTIATYVSNLFSAEKSAILRLRPPSHAEGIPTILLDAILAYRNIDEQHLLELDLRDLATAESPPIPVEITVFSTNSSGVPATVTVQAKQLYGGKFGGNLVYKQTFDTDPSGHFSALLVPGQYVFVAEPLDASLAITTVPKTIDAGTLGSITLELQPARALTGSATTPLGAPAHGVPVELLPTPPAPASYLQNQLSVANLKLGGDSTVTDGSGLFQLLVDPGEYDLRLQPQPATGLPWLLLPRLTIADTQEPLAPVTMGLTHPVVLTGQVRTPSEAAPGAIIRAFLPADAEGTTVVQVAETAAGPQGQYHLLLPGRSSSSQ